MSGHPNDNPVPVPYTSKLGSPLVAGQTINLHGNVNADAKRAEVNLLSGGPEIGGAGQAFLHVSLRFDEGKLVLNSFLDGAWGKEDRHSLYLKPGNPYDLRIRVNNDDFELRLNGEVVGTYKHRGPFANIEYFQVKGDVTLTGVHWGGKFYTLPWESGFTDGSLKAGQKIHLYVIPKGDRFNVDLIARNGDILFHFNPRFDQNKVVRNACKGGAWGNEEREGPFPFKKDCGFDLTIVNEPYSIQIFYNNEQLGTYSHRTQNPAEDYIGIRIGGDAEITGIEFSNA